MGGVDVRMSMKIITNVNIILENWPIRACPIAQKFGLVFSNWGGQKISPLRKRPPQGSLSI
jgi:hypothetical protein